ncbi:MAG: NAD(P)H-dependent oxidoreductase [Kordiimonadaceae bacterium]|nr:NAD(P)H-dependent oxidoreductase [Kordiimonadaceae bacterium]
MAKKVMILDGHPKSGSFSGALTEAARESAEAAGHTVQLVRLSDMTFDPDLAAGYAERQELEPDLKAFQKSLLWCDHFIIAHPLWWGAAPAKLKGLFDRALLPGFAFENVGGKALPIPLLKGRTAHVMITSDTPGWYLRWVYGAGWLKIFKRQILDFCGFSKVRFNTFGPFENSSAAQRQKFLLKAKKAVAGI